MIMSFVFFIIAGLNATAENNPQESLGGVFNCENVKQEYGGFWPTDNKCNCDSLSNLQAGDPEIFSDLLNGCKEQAKNAADECKRSAQSYIQDSTLSCEDPGLDYSAFCGSTDIKVFQSQEFYIAVENDIKDERKKCIDQHREQFKEIYTEQCTQKLNEIQGNNKTLLCAEKAEKKRPGCNTWCENKAHDTAESTYKASPNDLARYYFTKRHSSRGGFYDDGSINFLYLQLSSQNPRSENEKFINNHVTEQINAQFDGEGDPQNGFHWWQCNSDNGQTCESDLDQALDDAIKICAELRQEAIDCCHSPERCVGGALVHSLDGLAQLNVAIKSITGNRSKVCKAVQQAAGLYSGKEGAMAAQCTNKVNKCSQGCNAEITKVVEAFKEACNYDPRTGKDNYNAEEHTCDEKLFKKYVKKYKQENQSPDGAPIKITAVPKKCELTGNEANRNIQNMTTSLGAGLLAGMKECGMETPTPKQDPWKPVSMSCPPHCPMMPPGHGGTTGQQITPPGLNTPVKGGGGKDKKAPRDPFTNDTPTAANPFDQEPPDLGPEEDKGEGGPSGGMGALLSSGSGGGAGAGGGFGGGPSGGGGKGRGGGGRGNGNRSFGGKKHKILMGYHGGKFSGYGGGGSGRGRGGKTGGRRGLRGKKSEKRRLAKLDLKKLLPKKSVRNHKVSQFGSPHDDIFQRMSHRIQWMCRTDKIPCGK